MSLWGIPYPMRPGQAPADLERANNTSGWIYLGGPGWYGSMSPERVKEVTEWLASIQAPAPGHPAEWLDIRDWVGSTENGTKLVS